MPSGLRVMARPAFRNTFRNPYNCLLYAHLAQQGVAVAEYSPRCLVSQRWDILHIHWPESLLETASWLHAACSLVKQLTLIDLIRRNGTKLVWTVHDLHPHDFVFPRIENWFWHVFLRRVDALTALTEDGLRLARDRFPLLRNRPGYVIPHGHYRAYYPNEVSRGDARGRLGVPTNARVLTYFGQVRPYKNVPKLIATLRQLQDPDLLLFICGRLSKRIDMRRQLAEATAGDPRIQLRLQHIPDDEIQLYVNAADLVVLPYKEILNSGSALLALSFDRPVLAPNMGSIRDLQAAVGSRWLRTYDGELTAGMLSQALVWARIEAREGRAPLDQFDWRTIANRTIDAFTHVLAGAKPVGE